MNRDKISYNLILAGILLLVASLPLSRVVMSISQMFLIAGWLVGGDYKVKLQKFIHCRPALLIFSIYLLHIIGLLWSSDMEYAMKDLRIKVPLLILPFIFSSVKPLTKNHFILVLITGISAVIAGTLLSTAVYLGFMFDKVNDVRSISLFISHIRFALLICVSIFSSSWLAYHFYESSKIKSIIFLCAVIWLIAFLFILNSLTGLVIFFTVTILLAIYYLSKSGTRIIQFIIIILLTGVSYSTYKYVSGIMEQITEKPDVNFNALDTLTASGNEYQHNTVDRSSENGHYVWLYICEKELEKEWNSRSKINYRDKDLKGQSLKSTLLRYLTSLGYKKDSVGVSKLSDNDIGFIEQGLANHLYAKGGSITPRIREVLWEVNEYNNGGNPSGHSVVQRLEYWKTSIAIISKYPFFGVGTGDAPIAFHNQYQIMNTRLSEQWQLRSHNQYLAIGVTFGIVGLIWFLMALFYPLSSIYGRSSFLYITFFLIASLSMITEDTLETQAGVTFFAFFSCLYLFVNPYNDGVNQKNSRKHA
jgi:O-antigen ligase/polysaccharide polymerase Wzy-like membrane protein